MDTPTNPMQIFIVGGPRSGTTKIANSLRRALGYPHHGEGHWLSLYRAIGAAIDDHEKRYPEAHAIKANWVAQIDKVQLLRAISGFVLRDLAANGFVIDKTPGRVNMQAFLTYRKVIPNCRAVVMTRRGIENVSSRTRKWQRIPFEQHCRNWCVDIDVSLKVLETGAPAIRIDQFDIASDPTAVGRKLTRFLSLDEGQSRALRKTLTDANPEVTHADYRPLTLAETGWTEQEIATFRTICGATMERAGYSFDGSYWLNRPVEVQESAGSA